MPDTPALRMLSQEDYNVNASIGNLVKAYLRIKRVKKKPEDVAPWYSVCLVCVRM